MQRLNSKGCYISFLFALCSALNQAWLCVRLRRSFATLKITTLAEQSASKLALRSLNVLFDILIQTKNEIAISGRKKRPLTKLILIYTCFSLK